MNNTAEHYSELAHRLEAVAASVDAARWDAPSPCDGWSAADVVHHLITTQRDFLGEHGIDVGSGPGANADADANADDAATGPAKAWRSHTVDVIDVLARTGVAATTFNGFFGPTTVGETLAHFYGFDMIVHRWDLARATGLHTTFSPAELDQIETSIDGWGEHLYAEGICAPPVDIDPSSSRQDRLLARMGRDPR